ncbi:uncharacterized protein [Vicugna pacos]|uniref:Uncharacterized protein n=1 Tax=Vicugna pacos TaxID=30538 RepID=A0ABM5C7X3_VICPA
MAGSPLRPRLFGTSTPSSPCGRSGPGSCRRAPERPLPCHAQGQSANARQDSGRPPGPSPRPPGRGHLRASGLAVLWDAARSRPHGRRQGGRGSGEDTPMVSSPGAPQNATPRPNHDPTAPRATSSCLSTSLCTLSLDPGDARSYAGRSAPQPRAQGRAIKRASEWNYTRNIWNLYSNMQLGENTNGGEKTSCKTSCWEFRHTFCRRLLGQ